MKIYDPPPSSFDASPIFTGTVTFPDGSTWTSSGVTMAPGKTAALLVTTATSLALGGATIGTNALAVTGTAAISTSLSIAGATVAGGYGLGVADIAATTSIRVPLVGGLNVLQTADATGVITFRNSAQANNVQITLAGTQNFQLGGIAVDTAPVAQTLSVQNTLAGGTSNVAGANFTIAGSQGKGTGVGGDVGIQYAPAGSTGTTVNALVDGLRLKGTGSLVLGSAAIATNAADGFLYAVSGAGTPTGTPTTFTGRVPIYIDTTNSQLWLYMGGAWKQPKTPAGAATVTWQ